MHHTDFNLRRFIYLSRICLLRTNDEMCCVRGASGGRRALAAVVTFVREKLTVVTVLQGQAVFNQSQGQGWGRGGGDVAGQPGTRGVGGTYAAFLHPSWDCSLGWEEAVHLPTIVT